MFSDLTVTCFLIHCYVSWKDFFKSERSNSKLNVPVSLVGWILLHEELFVHSGFKNKYFGTF